MVEYERVGNTLRINARNWVIEPSIEDSAACMGVVIDVLQEVKDVERIVLVETREREYDYEQVKLLREIAEAHDKIVNQERFLIVSNFIPPVCRTLYSKITDELTFIVNQLLRKDPILAFVRVEMMIEREKKLAEKGDVKTRMCHRAYLEKILLPMREILEKCELIRMGKKLLSKYKLGDRGIYREIFKPLIRPSFMLTRYAIFPPKNGELVEKYFIGDIVVEIYKIPGKVRYLYHVTAPEFLLSEDEYAVLDAARSYLSAHRPSEAEVAEPERAREVFKNIGRDLIRDIASRMGLKLDAKKIEKLANILARYTAGFGVLEILLADPKITDIYINSPVGEIPIYVTHSEYEECETNLIPSKEDAEAWATRFRLYSGRPLDEANPVLDTELIVPGGRARVAAITRTLSPYGLGFALRRHRDKPWTFPLFMKVKFFDALYAGLMSFIIDGGRAVLVAGGRGSGKTSLLGAMMLEIMKKFRICVVEDTLELPVVQLRELGYNVERMKSRSVITRVEAELPAEEALRTALRLGDSVLIIGEVRSSLRGSEEVFVVHEGMAKRIPISEVERLKGRILVPGLNSNYKMSLEKLHHFVKHPPRKLFVEIVTRTGRKVIVTPEHSVFTVKNFKITETRADELKVGDEIVIPARLPCGFNDVEILDLTQILPDFRLKGVEDYIRKAIKKIGWKKACEILGVSDVYMYLRKDSNKCRIPISKFKKLMKEAGIEADLRQARIKNLTSKELPVFLEVDEDFCRFLGYYVSEGWIEDGKVLISNSDERIVRDVISIAKRKFLTEPRMRKTKGWGEAYQVIIFHKPLSTLLRRLGCGKTSKEKRIPPLVYGLSEKKIFSFLEGLYRGDGCLIVSKNGNTLKYSTKSPRLANDLLYLLLFVGVVGVLRKKYDKRYDNWLYEIIVKKREDLKKMLRNMNLLVDKKLVERSFSHSKLNTVKFKSTELEKHVKLKRKFRHLRRVERCSKEYLQKVVSECEADELIRKFAFGEFFIDKVKRVRFVLTRKPEYVYDLSVNPTQNFVGGFGGILLHNTEAKALFEAMRIGALANLVAGTIHGESAYGVYDRVVNDLGVPSTSFKAIDVITICNLLRTPDGLRRFRRVTELTEVRKHWREDPSEEGGFVNLMEYSAKEDRLKPTETLLNGESVVLNEIAKRVREWHGNWDAVWDNIMLRAKIKQTMVDYAIKLKRDDILEAPWVVESNEMFHLISDEVRREVGALDSKMIYERWLDWFKKKLKER